MATASPDAEQRPPCATVNAYLHKNLFGLTTNVQDTAYVVYNLYMLKLNWSACQQNPSHPPPASNDHGGVSCESLGATQVSDDGDPAETVRDVLISFLEALIEIAQLPLLDGPGLAPQATSQKESRLRFLRDVFAPRLPSEALQLVRCIEDVDQSCLGVLKFASSRREGESAFAAQPPSRQLQVERQGQARKLLQCVKDAKAALELSLDDVASVGASGDTADATGGAAHTTEAKFYSLLEDLYDDHLQPRTALAEVLCAVGSAFAVRTEDAVEFACRALDPVYAGCSTSVEGASKLGGVFQAIERIAAERRVPEADVVLEAMSQSERLQITPPHEDNGASYLSGLSTAQARFLLQAVTELPMPLLRLLDGLMFIRAFFKDVAVAAKREQRVEAFEASMGPAADTLCDYLMAVCSMPDVEHWMRQRFDAAAQTVTAKQRSVQEQSGEGHPLARKTGSFSSSRRSSPAPTFAHDSLERRASSRSLFGGSNASSSGPASPRSDMTPPRPPPTHASGISAVLQEVSLLADEAVSGAQDGDCGQRLLDALGRVNLFLRRSGLAREVRCNDGGKVVPLLATNRVVQDGDLFVPHEVDELLGFGAAQSELYARACLLCTELTEQQRVSQRLAELSEMPETAFFEACHDDLLERLLQQADEHCVTTAVRLTVMRRLQSLMTVRIKLFHFGGEVRAATVPQTHTLEQVLALFSEFWPSLAAECQLAYVDDSDKIALTTNREYQDLLRLRRQMVLEGMALGSSSIFGASRSGHLNASRSGMGSNSSVNALTLELFADPKTRTATKKQQSTPQPTALAPSTPLKSQVVGAAMTSSPLKMAVGPSSSLLEQLPGGMSINEYIRSMETQGQAHQARPWVAPQAPPLSTNHPSVDSMSMDELQRFYERKARSMGVALPAEVAPTPQRRAANGGNEANYRPPLPPPPALSSGDPASRPMAPPPPAQPTSATGASPARALFLAMGREKRGAPDVVDDLGSEDVVKIEARHRWRAPPAVAPTAAATGAALGELQVARHQFSGSQSFLKAFTPTEEMRKLLGDDDDDEVDQRPSWNRGPSNHYEAVAYSGGHQQQPARLNGPLRRNGVPLPSGNIKQQRPPSAPNPQPKKR